MEPQHLGSSSLGYLSDARERELGVPLCESMAWDLGWNGYTRTPGSLSLEHLTPGRRLWWVKGIDTPVSEMGSGMECWFFSLLVFLGPCFTKQIRNFSLHKWHKGFYFSLTALQIPLVSKFCIQSSDSFPTRKEDDFQNLCLPLTGVGNAGKRMKVLQCWWSWFQLNSIMKIMRWVSLELQHLC